MRVGRAGLLALFALLPLSALASSWDTSSAQYTQSLVAVNTGTSTTNTRIPFDISSSALVDNNIVASDGLNSALIGATTTLSALTDASFEDSSLTNWTSSVSPNHTAGTNARASGGKYGDYRYTMQVTASAGAGSSGRYQDVDATAGQVWSVSAWTALTAATGSASADLYMAWLDSNDAIIGAAVTTSLTTTGSIWRELQISNETAPANTASLRVMVRATTSAGGETLTAWFDGAIACQAAVPCPAKTHMPGFTRTAMEGALLYDTTGATYTDDTTDMNDAGLADVALFDADPEVNDAFYFGGNWPWRMLTLHLGNVGAGTWTLTWEYWDGAAWTALSNVDDKTGGFRAAIGTYAVTWDAPSNWTDVAVNGITSYWVRARTSAFTSVTTSPTASQGWWETAMWWVYADTLTANTQTQWTASYGGATDMTWDFLYTPGTAGVTVADDASIEPGNNWYLAIQGYWDTAAGAGKNLFFKNDAIEIYVSGASQVTVDTFNNACPGAATSSQVYNGVATGWHTLVIDNDNGTATQVTKIDGATVTSQGSINLCNNANNWEIASGGSTIAFSYATLLIATPLVQELLLELNTFPGLTMTDRGQGAANTGTPSYPGAVANLTTTENPLRSTDAVASVSGDSTAPDFVGSIDQPSNQYPTPGTTGTLLDLIFVPMNAGGWPLRILFGVTAMGFVLLCGLGALRVFQSLAVSLFVMGVVLFICTVSFNGLLPWWVFMSYVAIAAATLLAKERVLQ